MPRPKPPSRWGKPEETVGLLLVAQRIEECLFDYTVDSYKAPTLNTHTRCVELESALADVRARVLGARTLIPMIEELADSIRNDSAAQALLAPHASVLGDAERWPRERLSDIEAQIALVDGALRGRYEEELGRQILTLLPEAKEKDRLLRLITSLVVEWIHKGFSRDHIYYTTRSFFFGPKGPALDGPPAFAEFLKSFASKAKAWTVLLRGTKKFVHLKDFVADSFLQVLDIAPKERSTFSMEREWLARPHRGTYLLLPKVEALDPRAAHAKAARTLAAVVGIVHLHVHKESFAWDGDAIIYAPDNTPTVLRQSPSPVHKFRECPLDLLAGRFRATISAIIPANLKRQSFSRIQAALEFHSAAVTSHLVDNQLVSLWSALEALLATTTSDSRAARVIELLVPLLSLHYPAKLLQALHDSIIYKNEVTYPLVLAQVPGAVTDIERLAHIVAIEEHEPLRDKLYALLPKRPLVRNRLFALKEALGSAAKIDQTMTQHVKRVEWHLKRVYRSRNLLVHGGRKLPFREALVESLHSYVDQAFALLQARLATMKAPLDLDAALLSLRLDYDLHRDVVKRNPKAKCSTANCSSLVLGMDLDRP